MVFLGINAYAASPVPTGIDKAFNTDPGAPLNAIAIKGAGYNTSATFQTIIGAVLTMALGLMGVIFLVLAVYSGYNWMMARGNEEMVEKSKKTLTNAIIGIVVVLSAYLISRFVVEVIGGLVFKK